MRVYLSRWDWVASLPEAHWQAPVQRLADRQAGIRLLSALDLRPNIKAGQAGPGNAGHFGLFAYNTPIVSPLVEADLGDDPQGILSPARIAGIESRLGLVDGTITSTRLLDVVFEVMTQRAQVGGANRPNPILPGQDLKLSLSIGGVAKTVTLEPRASPEWGICRASLRESYRRVRSDTLAGRVRPNSHRKYLGALRRKYRIENHMEFVPPDLSDEGWLEPDTTVTDSFDRADSTDLGANWTEDRGDFQILTNVLDIVSLGASPNITAQATHNTSLSTDDHYSQALINRQTTGSAKGPGMIVRFGDIDNYYLGRVFILPVDLLLISKMVTGTPSDLALFEEDWTNGAEMELRVDGSTLNLYKDNVLKIGPITDTSLTGQLKVGVWTDDATSGVNWDTFEGADLAVAVARRRVGVGLGHSGRM